MENFWIAMNNMIKLNSKQSKNGECIMWNGPKDGRKRYGQIHYKDPRDHKWKHKSAHRFMLMLKNQDFTMDSAKDASHLCHNKLCINSEHLNLERRGINNQRNWCKNEGTCSGHGTEPDCKIHLIHVLATEQSRTARFI